jgi:DedD protein
MDFLMKQRLVGAIVLVALGVIFIPMLLEGPSDTLVPELEELPEFVDPGPEQPLEAFPAADKVPLEPGTSVVESAPEPLSDLEPVPASASAPAVQEAPPAQEPAGETASSSPDPALRGESGAAPAAVPEPEQRAEAQEAPPPPASGETESKPLGSWVVQLGSFSSQDKALALRDKARQKGFTTQVEKVRIREKTFFRVRVGPFLERGEAEQTQQRLAKTFQLEGRVLSYP